MPKRPFDASQFVATEWNSAADKAAFGNTYLHFIESGWKQSLFTKGFYQRLSNCFSHIAHYVESVIMQSWTVQTRMNGITGSLFAPHNPMADTQSSPARGCIFFVSMDYCFVRTRNQVRTESYVRWKRQ